MVKSLMKNNEEIVKLIDRFNKYKRRIDIIEEVINDLYLFKNADYSFNYVIDFYQIYKIINPPTASYKVEIFNNTIKVRIISIRDPIKLESLFRDRLRQLIPFFNKIPFCNTPLLIPPYKQELINASNNKVQNFILKRVDKYLLREQSRQILDLKEKWKESLKELKDNKFPQYCDKDKEKIIDELLNNVINGFYFVSLAISRHTELLNYLLEDKTHPSEHIIEIEKSKYDKARKRANLKKWIEEMERIRPNKTFSNVNDSTAISTIIELNKESFNNKKNELYFLLSDTEKIRELLHEKLKEDSLIKLPKEKINNNPMIKNDTCLLRTSFHFEELLLAIYKSKLIRWSDLDKPENIDILIKNLYDRKSSLLERTNIDPNFIEEMKKKHENQESCSHEDLKKFKGLENELNNFFKIENNETNLKNLTTGDFSLKYLLEFINKYFYQFKSNKEFKILHELEKFYMDFFKKDFLELEKVIPNIIKRIQEEIKVNINSTIRTSSVNSNTIYAFFHNIDKIEGINYEITFLKHHDIGTLFRNFKYPISNQFNNSDLKKWNSELLNILIDGPHDAYEYLLEIIIRFCCRDYKKAWKLATYYLGNNQELLYKNNLNIEYYFMLYSSEAMIEFNEIKYHGRKEENIANLQRIIDNIKNLFRAYHDPRLLFLIAKIYGYLFFFGISKDLEILGNAIRNLLEAIDLSIENSDYKFLKIPICNKLLWCFSNLYLGRRDIKNQDIKKLEKYYKEIKFYEKRCNYCDTIANYHYLHVKIFANYKFRQKKHFGKALYYLNAALISFEKEGYSKYDFEIISLNNQYISWRKEYIELFSIPEQDYEELEAKWKAKITKEFLEF